ncbi:hypothetical protein D3C81_1632970 [compost metagenome]
MAQGVVDPAAPVVLGLVLRGAGLCQVHPRPFRLQLRLGQRLIQAHQHAVGALAGDKGHHAQVRDGHAIAGTREAQVFQGGTDFPGQACRFLAVQPRGQQAEFAATVACGQPGPPFG